MSLDPRRLLGLAFATADLLIEVDQKGEVALAVGASRTLVDADASALMGRSCIAMFHPADRALMASLTAGLGEGERRGPIVVRLIGEPQRAAEARTFRVPGLSGVSLALTKSPLPPYVSADGLHTPATFDAASRSLIEAARLSGRELELAMVEIGGLSAARATMKPEAAAELDARVASELRLQSENGVGAARLGDERFAVVRERGLSVQDLARRLTGALSRDGDLGLGVQAQIVPVDGQGDTARALRAIRFALDDFAKEGVSEDPPLSLAEAMNRSVRRTLARAGQLGVAVSQRRFQLAFQPVVSMATGTAHHHEVLVRFEGGESPFSLIRMAEEFDLIEELDNAIVDQTVARLKANKSPDLRLAVNISGRTITSEAFIEHITDTLKRTEEARGRLIFEITESSAIEDLERADRHIQALRAMGSLVCLDDFGAGAASLAYLQQLSLDIVKIDGRYVREMAAGGRDAAMVKHIVGLCKELNIRTVAEMVETPDVEQAVRKAGVDFAQGWLYGRPAERPLPPTNVTPSKPPAARRVGSVDSWG